MTPRYLGVTDEMLRYVLRFLLLPFCSSPWPIADLRRDVLNRELRVAKIVSRQNVATDFSVSVFTLRDIMASYNRRFRSKVSFSWTYE